MVVFIFLVIFKYLNYFWQKTKTNNPDDKMQQRLQAAQHQAEMYKQQLRAKEEEAENYRKKLQEISETKHAQNT